jgi:hypothetical protein
MACACIDIWTTSKFFEEQVCLIMLICIEERNGLKYEMKEGACDTTATYLDQQQEMNNLWILVSVHECNIKCCPRIPDVAFSAEGNTFGDITYQ